MAVIFKDKIMYEGCVLCIREKYWLDGMLEKWALCWDDEKQTIEDVTFGYYAIEGSNLAGGSAKVDATKETWRKVIRHLKPQAIRDYAQSVIDYKREVRKGSHVKVIKGKKIPKGTELEVFWIGEKPTFLSMRYEFIRETEKIAGCYDRLGNKIWIKAEYLMVTDEIKSPNRHERKKYIDAHINEALKRLNAPFQIRI